MSGDDPRETPTAGGLCGVQGAEPNDADPPRGALSFSRAYKHTSTRWSVDPASLASTAESVPSRSSTHACGLPAAADVSRTGGATVAAGRRVPTPKKGTLKRTGPAAGSSETPMATGCHQPTAQEVALGHHVSSWFAVLWGL